MTRVLLATLVFYRRWLSPALHSLNPGGGCRYVPTCSALTMCPLRPRTRLAHPNAKPSLPTNRYHRRSGGLTV